MRHGKAAMSKKPFILNTILAVASCKCVRSLLRRSGKGGGTALPGKVAMKFSRNVLGTVSSGVDTIVVTGTNGKTTTCNILETALTDSGKDVLANKSGANLLSGITAEFCCSADWLGHPRKRIAVIECDEGALKQVVPLIHPRIIVVTNLFRDQLDRYGEVMNTRNQIRIGIEKVPDSTLVLNAEDSLVSSLALDVPNPAVYFGLNVPVGDQSPREISDAMHCIRCGTRYEYNYYTYAHLGDFYCPKCGYRRAKPDYAVQSIDSTGADSSEVTMKIGGRSTKVSVGLPAVYNIYNAAAAIAAYVTFGGRAEDVIAALKNIHSAFGRMETFDLPRKMMTRAETGHPAAAADAALDRMNSVTPVRMILVKNPAGCSQTIEYLTGLPEDYRLLLCLNDRTADGHDISWIWDADYEKLADCGHLRDIWVSGDRAEDLRLRLKYAGIPMDRVHLEKDNSRLLSMMARSGLPVFVMPNYTSMLALRELLSEATGKKEFWEKQS